MESEGFMPPFEGRGEGKFRKTARGSSAENKCGAVLLIQENRDAAL
jgi:hypothetical protein